MFASQPPVVIVLAAGQGSRFAAPVHKLMQPLAAGHTVLQHTLQQVRASGLPLLVVASRALAADVARWVAANEMLVLSPEVTLGRPVGMGTSIAAGVLARSRAPGWLLLPADMPLVRASTFRAVAAGLQRAAVVHAQHKGLRGHPVGFAAELYSELVQLAGDQGAKRLLARYAAEGVEVDDPGVLIDIDTAADLQHAEKAASTLQPG